MAEPQEPQEWEEINLLTVAKGALPELFGREHLAVLENMADPNTNAAAKRQIVIKLTYIPRGAEGCEIVSDVSSKLAPVKQVGQVVHLAVGRDGRRSAYAHNVQQATIPGVLAPAPASAGVTPINRATQG